MESAFNVLYVGIGRLSTQRVLCEYLCDKSLKDHREEVLLIISQLR